MDYVIETHGLTKRFGTFEAVSTLNLRVAANHVTGFLGRNGAGKSTTIKMLLGMTHPSCGSGTALGRAITDAKENREMRRKVAYVGEDKQLYAYMTVDQLIRFTGSFYPDWRTEVAQRLRHQYQLPSNRKVKALSKGMRTKLALLLALARRPALLILDEPSEGLDPVSIEELLQTLAGVAAEGTSVFFSSHQIAEVERMRAYSKGMLQRVGLAQALIHEPDLIFLDEPTSGLDPVGRRLVRDIIKIQKERGATIFLNSHLLSEVEVTCDRVAFIRAGKVMEVRAMEEFENSGCDVAVRVGSISESVLPGLSEWAAKVHLAGPHLLLKLHNASFAPCVVKYLVENSVEIFEFTSRRISLEDRFMEILGIDDGL